jgi:ribonuclease J
MISLTFYGGVEEIGGNKVLLQEGDTSLFFDFGVSFNRRYHYFEEYLKPRPGAGILDLLEMGLVPPLRGIYRDDLAPEDVLAHFDCQELTLEGILLSHAHVDHSGYISFLREDIPIYTTKMTAFIAKAMQDSAPMDIEREVCYSNPREMRGDYRTPKGGKLQQRPFQFLDCHTMSNKASDFWNKSPLKPKTRAIEPRSAPGEAGMVGSLPIRYFPVDHSIPGACSFAVETSLGWVAYTGDLRMHGKLGRKSEHAIEQMSALHPHILICEGTRVDEGESTSEEEVYHAALQMVRQERGLIIADFGPRNVERLLTFLNIAQQTSRRLVILAKDAYLLEAMRLVSEDIPDLEESTEILLYKDLKALPGNWEIDIRKQLSGRIVTAPEIHACQGDYILCFSFWDIKNLIDIKPEGGLYIFSTSEAHNEEQELDIWRLYNWIEHFELRARGLPRGKPESKGEGWKVPEGEQTLHSSGHASGSELFGLIRSVAPQILIPIHTLEPDYFKREFSGTGIEVRRPQCGEEMRF